MHYEVLPLADIPIDRLTLVKQSVRWYGDQDHSRWVFRTSRSARLAGNDDVYVKLWNPTYVRRDNVLHGIDAGFYDVEVTPALRAVIFHRGACRGYVMHRAERDRGPHPGLYEIVKQKTARSGYCHVQFSPYHTLRYRDTWTLIDLDAIYPIRELPGIHALHAAFDCDEYERFVADLFNQAFPDGPAYVCPPRREPSPVNRGAWMRAARFTSQRSQALYRIVRRWADVTLMNQRHLIES